MIYNNQTSRKIVLNLSIAGETDSWTQTWNYNRSTYAYSIVNDSSDNIYVIGFSNKGGCLLKYNNSGDLLWYQLFIFWPWSFSQNRY